MQANPITSISTYGKIYLLFSLGLIAVSCLLIYIWGINFGSDFRGGVVHEIEIQPKEGTTISRNQVKTHIQTLIPVQTIQELGIYKYQFHFGTAAQGKKEAIESKLQELGEVKTIQFSEVSAAIVQAQPSKAITLTGVAFIGIFLLVSWRFHSWIYGLSAVVAVLHDVIIVIGAVAGVGKVVGASIDAFFITAIVTILSFSIHDTIIVFDRIREFQKHNRKATFKSSVDAAVENTIVRSIRNSLTILFMLFALLLIGPESLRWFIFTLLIGTIVGTYSSTFTALPLLLLFSRIGLKLSKTSITWKKKRETVGVK